MKRSIKNILLCAAAYAFVFTNAMAEDDEKFIWKLKVGHGDEFSALLHDSDSDSVIELTREEFMDQGLLEVRLAALDYEKRTKVLEALRKARTYMDEDTFSEDDGSVKKHKMIVLKSAEGEDIETHSKFIELLGAHEEHDDVNVFTNKKVFVTSANGLHTDKTNLIETLISKGEFSQEQLDKLQAALDAKR